MSVWWSLVNRLGGVACGAEFTLFTSIGRGVNILLNVQVSEIFKCKEEVTANLCSLVLVRLHFKKRHTC